MNTATTPRQSEFTRINNDINGNPRYVCHFTDLITDKDRQLQAQQADKLKSQGKIVWYSITDLYPLAVKRANKLGGRKFHNKQYGGGIVFQSYSTNELEKQINDLLATC